MALQDRAVAITAIICATVATIALVGGLCLVAILSGDIAVGAVGVALGAIVMQAVRVWADRRKGGTS